MLIQMFSQNLPELMTNIKNITKYMNQKATERAQIDLPITMIDTLDEILIYIPYTRFHV